MYTNKLNWCNKINVTKSKIPNVSDVSTSKFKKAIIKYNTLKVNSSKLKKLLTLSIKVILKIDQFIRSYQLALLNPGMFDLYTVRLSSNRDKPVRLFVLQTRPLFTQRLLKWFL